MALVIINRNAPESNQIVRLVTLLRQTQELAEYLNEVGANATDANLETVFGVPQTSGTVFKNTVSSLVTALQATAVNNYINNVG